MPSTSSQATKPFKLGLVLFPGCMPAGLFATADMVRACNMRAGRELMQVTWVAADRRAVPTHQGPALRADTALADAGLDACLLPGLWLASTDALDEALHAHRPLIDALRAQAASCQVWSYCAGVALAAAAGRLDRRDATATWWLHPALQARFPRVRWHRSPDIVASASVVTASGPSGYLPLMLDQLARRTTAEVLEDVQELLMLPRPRARHAAFEAVEMMGLQDPELRALLAWTQRTPAQEVSLAGAAGHLKMSVRTLCRRIAGGTEMAAGEWLRLAKLNQAAEALRASRTPVKAISDELGFASEGGLYRAFKAATGLTPSAYRQAYGRSPARPAGAGRAATPP